MGNSPGLRHCNAPHKIGLGWLPANQVVTGGSGVYTLKAVAEPGPGLRVVRIPVSGADDVYVSFRNFARFDNELHPIYANRTSMHTWSGATHGRTFLHRTLPDGHSYTLDGITVTQLSNDGVSATVQVSVVTTANRPTLTVAPAEGAAQPGATGTYSLTITNRDSGTSPPTTFDFVASGQARGWTYEVDPASVTVPAGTSATVLVRVTSLPTDRDTRAGVTVYATGSAPIHAAQASLTHAVDGTAPTAPSALLASGGIGEVKLLWTPSQDANEHLGLVYRIWRDGVLVGQVAGGATVGNRGTQQSYLDRCGPGTFSYEVSCVDAAGNESGRSNLVTATASGVAGK
jgi:hypothetical protein